LPASGVVLPSDILSDEPVPAGSSIVIQTTVLRLRKLERTLRNAQGAAELAKHVG